MQINLLNHSAQFWETDNGHVRCTLCPHQCELSEGQSGICMVRKVIDGQLCSMVYGLPSAVRVDPIEKKPLYHYLPASKTYSIGTQGCNLKCNFCQNWHLSTQFGHSNEKHSPADIIEQALEHSCNSIAFTYNEPTVFAEYMMDIRDLAKDHDLACILVTNGYIMPEARKEVYKNIDAVNIDLKAFTDATYKKYTGGRLKPVLNTIKWCMEQNIHTEITTLLIPGANDDPELFTKECKWLVKNCGENIAFHINAFHPEHKMIDYPRTSKSTLKKCKEIALNAGLKYVYVGNYPGFDNNTYCADCHKAIIERKAYDIKVNEHEQHKLPVKWSVT